ncbi:MAG TPA: hypothetical protein ENJ55_08205 [Rhizobiales bacterium]|nr:hypothetical protein [Hyphomicrobiales bacterium]
MTLSKIRLELARSPEFPAGSHLHGFEFTAPLDEDGSINVDEWKAHREQCRVEHFWGDQSHEIGHLVRKPGGSWAFHYDIHGDPDDDDAGYRFGVHPFVPGEYVSIKDHDTDEMHTFKVVTVQPI